jgi:hypothetical protein
MKKKMELVEDFMKRRIWGEDSDELQKKILNKLFMNELRLWDSDASVDMFYDVDVLENVLEDMTEKLERIYRKIKENEKNRIL